MYLYIKIDYLCISVYNQQKKREKNLSLKVYSLEIVHELIRIEEASLRLGSCLLGIIVVERVGLESFAALSHWWTRSFSNMKYGLALFLIGLKRLSSTLA